MPHCGPGQGTESLRNLSAVFSSVAAALELNGKLSETKFPDQTRKSFYAWFSSDLICAGELVDHLCRPSQNFSGNGHAQLSFPRPARERERVRVSLANLVPAE